MVLKGTTMAKPGLALEYEKMTTGRRLHISGGEKLRLVYARTRKRLSYPI